MSKEGFDKLEDVRKGCVVLLVDDEQEYVRVLGERLRNRGFRVLTATSGEEALRKLDDKKAVSGSVARSTSEDVEV